LAAGPLRARRGPPSGRAGCYARRWARRGAGTRAALLDLHGTAFLGGVPDANPGPRSVLGG